MRCIRRKRDTNHRQHAHGKELVDHRAHIFPRRSVGAGVEHIVAPAHQQHIGPVGAKAALAQLREHPALHARQHAAGRVAVDALIDKLPARLLCAQPRPPLRQMHAVSKGQAVTDADQFHVLSTRVSFGSMVSKKALKVYTFKAFPWWR